MLFECVDFGARTHHLETRRRIALSGFSIAAALRQLFSEAETCRELKEAKTFENTRRPFLKPSSTFGFSETRVSARCLFLAIKSRQETSLRSASWRN